MKKQKDIVGLRHRRKHKSRKQHPTTPPTTPPLCSYILSDGSKCRAKVKGREKRINERGKGSFENPINFPHLLYGSQYKHVCIECLLGVSFTSPTIITPPQLNESISTPSSPISPMVHFCLIALFFLFYFILDSK